MNKKGRPPWNAPAELLAEYPRLSITALATKYGKSRKTIQLALQRGLVELRPLEVALGRHQWTDAEVAEMQRLYSEEQMSIATIASKVEVGYSGVRSALLRAGTVLRARNTCGLHGPLPAVTRKKIGDAQRGRPGKPLTDKQKEFLRVIHTGRKHSAQTLSKMSQTRIERGLSKGELNPMSNEANVRKWAFSNHLKPNRAESQLEQLLNEVCPGQYKINVTGSVLVLSGKIPDFVNLMDRAIIEHYGDYWHSGEDESERINFFAQFGYRTLIVWEYELKDKEKLSDKLVQWQSSL